MNKLFRIKFLIILSLLLPFAFISNIQADALGSLLSPGSSTDSQKAEKGPTVITSQTMDIDMKSNIITLTGNVFVNDPKATINSDQMIVYIDKKTKKAKTIVAIGNVVIVQKISKSEEKAKGVRKSTAGRANYNVNTGVIVLTEHPVIFQGGSYIKGKQITIWRNSDRMKVEGAQQTGKTSTLVLKNNVLGNSDLKSEK
jgi:lipopolysaccharide transport protein LptA